MFKIKRLRWSKGFILAKPNGKQFTANVFRKKTEAEHFLAQLIRDAKEIIEAMAVSND